MGGGDEAYADHASLDMGCSIFEYFHNEGLKYNQPITTWGLLVSNVSIVPPRVIQPNASKIGQKRRNDKSFGVFIADHSNCSSIRAELSCALSKGYPLSAGELGTVAQSARTNVKRYQPCTLVAQTIRKCIGYYLQLWSLVLPQTLSSPRAEA